MMNSTGYCGLQCNECTLYIAFHTGDKALMERTAREYSTVDCVFEKEEMRCGGCQSDIVPEKMCAGCEMRPVCVLYFSRYKISRMGRLLFQ